MNLGVQAGGTDHNLAQTLCVHQAVLVPIERFENSASDP